MSFTKFFEEETAWGWLTSTKSIMLPLDVCHRDAII